MDRRNIRQANVLETIPRNECVSRLWSSVESYDRTRECVVNTTCGLYEAIEVKLKTLCGGRHVSQCEYGIAAADGAGRNFCIAIGSAATRTGIKKHIHAVVLNQRHHGRVRGYNRDGHKLVGEPSRVGLNLNCGRVEENIVD